MSFRNPENYAPLVICGTTGRKKHNRALELRKERHVPGADIDGIPVVLRLDPRVPAGFQAFAALAGSYQVIGVFAGDTEYLAECFAKVGVVMPADTETEICNG